MNHSKIVKNEYQHTKNKEIYIKLIPCLNIINKREKYSHLFLKWAVQM